MYIVYCFCKCYELSYVYAVFVSFKFIIINTDNSILPIFAYYLYGFRCIDWLWFYYNTVACFYILFTLYIIPSENIPALDYTHQSRDYIYNYIWKLLVITPPSVEIYDVISFCPEPQSGNYRSAAPHIP